MPNLKQRNVGMNSKKSRRNSKTSNVLNVVTFSTSNRGTLTPDFILLNLGGRLEIVEIKRRWHVFVDEEYERLQST
jgi:hypothetical protein